MNEEEVFQSARRIEDPAERRVFVERACAGDTVLVERIAKLLRVCTEDNTFLASPAVETLDTNFREPLESIGSQAGPYRLVELIGEGGFGLVYRAEQEQPVRRSVAIKLIKPGMDSRQTVARFQAEQQALALMNHPSIADIFDCGQTVSGRPWFAMEYVPGNSITDFADEQKMEVRERLVLMLEVCSAVEHAHQKGVIHRDLKPSNILVSRDNGQAQLKVIDFGIAKAVQGSLSGGLSITQGVCLMGTPLYMSPEQVDSSPNNVDTRSDIYSLGVILYELLTGRTPLDRQQLASFSLDQVMKLIREHEPPRPSQVYRSSDSIANSSAVNRGMTISGLAAICRQDLDWIVMKCLEKDKQRRYQSVSELRNDLQRYLNGKTVLAGPPSRILQLRKLIRRNQGAFLAVTAILLSLLLGLGLSVSQAVRATRAEVAAKRDRDIAIAEQSRADEENQIAQAVTRFVMDDLLGQADLSNQPDDSQRDPEVKVKELIRRASQRVGDRFSDKPQIEIAIRRTLSSAWLALGEIPAAVEHAREAVRLSQFQYQPDDRQRQISDQILAQALVEAGQSAEAIQLATQVHDYFQSTLGEDHIDTQRSTGLLASALNIGGLLKESEELLKQTLVRRQQLLGAEHDETLRASYNLATVQAKLGKLGQAEEIFRNSVKQRMQNNQADHPETVREMLALASVLQLQEKFEESERFYHQADELAQELLGHDHPVTLNIANDLANLYASTQREELAGQMYQKVMGARKKKLGDNHPATWDAMNNLAIHLAENGNTDQAMPLLTEVVRLRQETHGMAHLDTVLALNNLAYLHRSLGNEAQAIDCYQDAIQGAEQTLPDDHPQLITMKTNLAIAFRENDLPDRAELLLTEVLAAARKRYGEFSKDVATTLGRLALVLHVQEKFDEAEGIARQQLAIRIQLHPQLWTTAWSRSLLGTILASQDKFDEASTNLVEGATFISKNLDQVPEVGLSNARQSLDWVVEFFEKTGDADQAEYWRGIRDAKFSKDG